MSTIKRENTSDSSTSESEVSACSSNYNPLKALYSDKVRVPVDSAPLYENIAQFEAALVQQEIIPVGKTELVQQREEEKERKRVEEEKRLEEKNKQRFAQYKGLEPKKKEFRVRNVLTRMQAIEGPLEMLQVWVEKRLRVRIITRNDRGVRGVLHAAVVAFDKHWNLALSDVLEIWYKKVIKKGKTPPAMGTPVPKGTAATIFPVPEVNECLISKDLMQCTRQIPQLMVRGEHIVLVHVSQ